MISMIGDVLKIPDIGNADLRHLSHCIPSNFGILAGCFLGFVQPPLDFVSRLPGCRLIPIDSVLRDGRFNLAHGDRSLVGKRLERGNRDVVPVDFEKLAQCHTIIAAAKSIGAETNVTSGHKWPNLLGNARM